VRGSREERKGGRDIRGGFCCLWSCGVGGGEGMMLGQVRSRKAPWPLLQLSPT